jgi:protein SCO1/2
MKKKGFFIATGLLVVPVAIFYMLNAGSQNFKKLGYLGERISPDGIGIKDTIYYTVPDFSGIDQSGDTLNSNDLTNNVFVANFFFASCKDVCPSMNRRLQKKVYDRFKEFAEVKFVSFTVDPTNDSTQVLLAYSKRFNADPKIWHFVNAGNEGVFEIGQGMLLPVSIEDKTIDHSQQLILIDKAKHIRGVYDSGSDIDLKHLDEDIKVLLYEYHQPGK